METQLAAEPPAAFEPALAERVDAWLASAIARAAPLGFREIRTGVQALSQRYVERRPPGDALGSPAKRAAFATYYAALHLATAFGAARALSPPAFAGTARIVDLGAGSGAVGAGVALALAPATPALLALDRSGFALAEARHTHAAFALRGETRRAQLPSDLPRLAQGDLAVAGWFLNECDDPARERVLSALERGADAGARVLVLEPLSGRAVPWWDALAMRLATRGIASGSLRWTMQRPAWVADMDKAAHLDHRELGVRIAFGPRARA